MSSDGESLVRATSYMPRRFEFGTFPVSKNYNLGQMLYNHARTGGIHTNSKENLSNQVIPSFPFSDVPVYADTVDIETLAFHNFWGCILTPDNVAARIYTDDLRYHVWVAAKRVVESGRVKLTDKEGLIRAATDQFMVELGLVLLDLCPGPLVLFVDPRFQDDSKQMIAQARALVAKFGEADVRRWRIVITLPATEQGICAAAELTKRHGIQTNLSLVSCLEHAAACIEAGAAMISMSIEPILEWCGQRYGSRGVSRDHPGIEAIQSCATYIRRHGLNNTLLTTDVRKWAELKQLGGIGATALTKEQLDQIPMQRLATWYPRADDVSPPTLRALREAYPSHYLDSDKGFLASLQAECRSLVSAVLHVRLSKMMSHMETIEKVVWYEVKHRIRLEKIPLGLLYARRPLSESQTPAKDPLSRRSLLSPRTSTSSSSYERSNSKPRRSYRQEKKEPLRTEAVPDPTMVEGVDYF